MSEAEAQALIESMKERTKEITSSKESAIQFLEKVGILTSEGEFTDQYQELGKACTAHTQD